ncbi:MAG: DUF2892 domain-containing protein [Candidatus Omnitrophota bacterium]|jgi:hypothetical protein|nr:MAG: DUF2892 domain-containing protein [Candidatus Omnitrophota bacterium]
MTSERIVRIVAGAFVLISLSLGWLHSHWWFCFTAFVGLNLFQSGFTNYCPLEVILKKCNIPSCESGKENTNVS